MSEGIPIGDAEKEAKEVVFKPMTDKVIPVGDSEKAK